MLAGSYVDAAGVQTLEGRPDVVARVGALVVQEPRFASLLQDGMGRTSGQSIGKCKSWLHNGAAVVFRLHALLIDGSLAVSPALGDTLRAAHEAIFEPLERFSKPLDAHGAILGGLYMQVRMHHAHSRTHPPATLARSHSLQAIMAWTSAFRCGSSSEAALRETVRRTGRAVAKLVGSNRQKATEARATSHSWHERESCAIIPAVLHARRCGSTCGPSSSRSRTSPSGAASRRTRSPRCCSDWRFAVTGASHP